MKTPTANTCLMRAVCLLTILALPLSAQAPFPGPLPGVQLGGGLLTGFEPAGADWHPGQLRLFVVDDGGFMMSMNPDGSSTESWYVDSNLGSVTVADPSSPFIYIGAAWPERIIEFDLSANLTTRVFPLANVLTGIAGNDVKAMTFVPNLANPEGGTFLVEFNGEDELVELSLPLKSDPTSTTVTALSTIEPNVSNFDISGIDYVEQTGTLFICDDGSSLVVECTLTGAGINMWTLPGIGQTGITAAGCQVFIAHESGSVMRYTVPSTPSNCGPLIYNVSINANQDGLVSLTGGQPQALYGLFQSNHPNNATQPGGGWLQGLHITSSDFMLQMSLGQAGSPMFGGNLDNTGALSHTIPGMGTFPFLSGQTFWGIGIQLLPGNQLDASNISQITFP